MIAQFDRALCAELIANVSPQHRLGGDLGLTQAGQLADQLEAAVSEIDRIRTAARAQAQHDRELIGLLENYVDQKPSREALLAEVERLQRELASRVDPDPESVWR